MEEPFDPYRTWLGIPSSRRPPSPWDILGLNEGETDPDRIREAVAARYEQIRNLTLGPHREHAMRLLDEISEAFVSLTKVGEEAAEDTATPPESERTEQVRQPVVDAVLASPASGAATDDGHDAYYNWLGIPPSKRPPSPYDILDIDESETNPDRIRRAAAARRARVGRLTLGPQREYALRLMKDISESLAILTGAEGERAAGPVEPAPRGQPLRAASDLARTAEDLASRVGVALQEEGPTNFDGAEAANEAKSKLQAELPRQPSAYVPSGELPDAALGMMLAGAVIGVPAGTATALVVLLAGGIICALLNGLIVWFSVTCCQCVPAVFLVLFAILTFLFVGAGAGVSSAGVITSMGKQAKNRNRPMPVVLSLVAGALAAVAAMFVLTAVISATDAGRLGGAAVYLAEYSGSPAVFWVVTGIVVFFAMVAGGACADELVLNAKFCEPCQVHMDSVKLRSVTLGGLRLLVAAVKQGNVRPAIGVYQSHRGKDGTSALFTCPKCSRGVLDISAAFNGKYKDQQGTEQTVQETWIVSSAKLGPVEVKRLLPFVEE